MKCQFEQIEIQKREIFSQIYDINLGFNSRLSKFNEEIVGSISENQIRTIKFEENLLQENSKFAEFLTSQISYSENNIKKIIDYINSDMIIIKDKLFNNENMIKTIRNEFFKNISEVEEYFTKKYEYLFKNIHFNTGTSYLTSGK